LRRLGSAIRRRPRRTALAVTVLVLAAAGGGLYAYGLHEWRAAQDALKEGRAADAQTDLRPCLLLWPNSARVHLLAARAARLQRDFAGAENHLNEGLKLDPQAKADIQLEFLLMRVQGGEEDDVAPDLLAYVDQKHPDSALILETLARAYLLKLRYGPALGALNRWIKEAPDAAQPYQLRGWVMERLDSSDAAFKDYQRAVELDPDHIGPRLQLTELYLDRANTTEALPHLNILRKQAPDLPAVQQLLGRCLFLQGHGDQARPLLEAAVQKMPDDPPLLLTRAKLDLQDGRAAQAEEWARRALKADPTDAEARYTLVSILRYQGREDEATAALEQYTKDAASLRLAEKALKEETSHPTDDPAVYAQIGSLFLRGGQDQIGEYYLQKALELDPNHQPALQALADFYEGKGDRETADALRGRLTEAEKEARR